MTDEEDKPQYDLVMPFVLAQSNGGPFEDKAFAAGWALGELDVKMKLAKALGQTPEFVYMERVFQPQIDLLAMKNGYVATTVELEKDDDPDELFWGYSFTRYTEVF